MKLETAKAIAEKYVGLLKPFCERIEIAGSIRRDRQDVGDIELVCIPKSTTVEDNIFDSVEVRDPGFINMVNSFYRVKGDGTGKYVQVKLHEEINLDLFITTREQWGVVFMLRTGSAMFSNRMAHEIKPRFYCDGGFLKIKTGEVVPCYEEEDFFRITGTHYVEPFARVV